MADMPCAGINGITLPSSESQKALIWQTYANAGLDWASDTGRCQFFEAHGTGTPVGYPIEARAIHDAFFGDDASSGGAAMLVGSVKTAIGHLEGCAGLAGLIKAVEAVRRGIVPSNMLLERLNPAIEPLSARLRVPTAAEPWPELPPTALRRASVNSFGFGDTNAHAIVESFTGAGAAPEPAGEDGPAATPLVVSANSERSLRRLVAALNETLGAPANGGRLDGALLTLATWRSQLPLRATFSGRSLPRLREKLASAATSVDGMNFAEAVRPPGVPGRILGIFTGQGAQWPAMDRELLRASGFARRVMARLEKSLASP